MFPVVKLHNSIRLIDEDSIDDSDLYLESGFYKLKSYGEYFPLFQIDQLDENKNVITSFYLGVETFGLFMKNLLEQSNKYNWDID